MNGARDGKKNGKNGQTKRGDDRVEERTKLVELSRQNFEQDKEYRKIRNSNVMHYRCNLK